MYRGDEYTRAKSLCSDVGNYVILSEEMNAHVHHNKTSATSEALPSSEQAVWFSAQQTRAATPRLPLSWLVCDLYRRFLSGRWLVDWVVSKTSRASLGICSSHVAYNSNMKWKVMGSLIRLRESALSNGSFQINAYKKTNQWFVYVVTSLRHRVASLFVAFYFD